jgi:putative ABC transport system substrate-binding protein
VKRRGLLGAAGARLLLAALAAGPAARALAQPTAVKRVAVLYPVAGPYGPGTSLDILRQRLRELGHVEGQNLVLEVLSAPPPALELPQQVATLLQNPPDVIVAGTTAAVRVARAATKTVPIVMAVSGDPVADGLVASLAQPGGNVTGMSIMTPEVNGKRVQLIAEAVPGLARIAVFVEPAGPRYAAEVREHEEAARRLGLALTMLPIHGPADFAPAFEAARRERVQALVLPQSPTFYIHRLRLAALALEHRLPAVAGNGDDQFARAGGLMNYGASIDASWRRSADYVHKILRGANPASLPIEQPDRFEFVINRRTAQALGLTIPPHLYVMADEVIR